MVKFVFVLLSSISTGGWCRCRELLSPVFPNYTGWGKAIWVQNTIALLATLAVIVGVGWLARRMIKAEHAALVQEGVPLAGAAGQPGLPTPALLDILQTSRAAPSAWS